MINNQQNNNNCDYSGDTDENGLNTDELNIVNKISAINIKANNINQINKKPTIDNLYYRTNICRTEPDEFINNNYISNRNNLNVFSSNSFVDNNARHLRNVNNIMQINKPIGNNLYTPQKHLSNPSNNAFNNFTSYNKFIGNNLMSNFNYTPNTQGQVINRSSMVSNNTDYSSNNKKRQGGLNDEGSEYFEDHNSNSISEE